MPIVQPETKALKIVLKACIKVLKMKFKSKNSPYHPEFVKKVLQGKEDIKNGKGVKIAIEDLWK